MNIVGITACPTGIAHTYMAQEALEEAGRKRGHQIKLETQGAMGAENEITEEDLKTADVVLIAVGCAVEGMERFDGKCSNRKARKSGLRKHCLKWKLYSS